MKDKIYYCNITGEVLYVMASLSGVKETTFDEDYQRFQALNSRVKDTISLLELKYGDFNKISKNSTAMSVNLETKQLEFTYDEITQEPDIIEVIESKISILESENEKLKEGLQAVLRGDMQSLAYILYPEDFNNQATLELK